MTTEAERQLDYELAKAIQKIAAIEEARVQRDRYRDGLQYVLRHLRRALTLDPKEIGFEFAWSAWIEKTQRINVRDNVTLLAERNRLGADPEQRFARLLAELKSMAAAIERKDELSQTTMLGACPGCGRPLSDADDLSGECDHYNEVQCRGGMFGGCCSCTCSDYGE